MRLLVFAALCALVGIVCIVIPFGIWTTGACLLTLAAVLAVLWALKRRGAKKIWSRILIALTALGMAAVFAAMGAIALQGRDSRMEKTPEFIVVLGAQIQGERPSLTLQKRLDKTAELMRENPETRVIVSGGQGADEITTEASVMKRYLCEKGIDPERITEEENATTTRENLIFSAALARESGLNTDSVLIVTSDFHMARAKYIARSLGMTPYGLAGDTWPWILKVNYTLREVFAFCKAVYQANR